MDVQQIYIRRIINLRESKDLNKSQMAKILNVPQKTYNNYENGKRVLPYNVLIDIADFFGVSTDYILGRTDKR